MYNFYRIFTYTWAPSQENKNLKKWLLGGVYNLEGEYQMEDVKQPYHGDLTQAPDTVSADGTNRKQTPARMKAPGPN